MKRLIFWLAYVTSPLPPILFYLNSGGGWNGGYSLSVVLGVAAFVLFCNQIILASRPRILVNTLGLKQIIALHSILPIFILIAAFAHRTLKLDIGFGDETLQARLGGAAFIVFCLSIAIAVLVMANASLARTAVVKAVREWLRTKLGLDYKRARMIHTIAIIACALALAHGLLASSSDFGANTAGAIWLAAWFVLSLALYARHKAKAKAASF